MIGFNAMKSFEIFKLNDEHVTRIALKFWTEQVIERIFPKKVEKNN